MPTIAVLGAGPGLGLAVAKRFGTGGYDVVLVARRSEALADHVARLGANGVGAEAVAPFGGRVIMPFMATKPAKAMLRRAGM